MGQEHKNILGNPKSYFAKFLDAPVITWVLLGFFITYFLLFINPVFLSHAQRIKYFRYIPRGKTVGLDFKYMLSYCKAWLFEDQTPYKISDTIYPPLTVIIFSPLTIFTPNVAYKIISIFNLLCFTYITLCFPRLVSKYKRLSPVIIFIFITGLFSYGFQFELERGQFNVIAMAFCFLAIYLYHKDHKYRYLAYIIFSISVQLKLYPAIFVLAFTKDFSAWKNNIKRFLGIALFNLSLLFVLGFNIFIDFLYAMQKANFPKDVGRVNHSIFSFATYLVKTELLKNYKNITEIALFVIFLLLFGIILFMTAKQKLSGLSPYLMLGCTMGTLLIPPVSFDYKLSILPCSVAIFLDSIEKIEGKRYKRLIQVLMLILIGIAYSCTLFSYTNKGHLFSQVHLFFIDNNFLPLLSILAATTVICFIRKKGSPNPGVSDP